MSGESNTSGIFPDNGSYNVFEETVDPDRKIEDLLEKEEARLLNKKKVIDPLYNTKVRQDSQLRSMTLRKNAYNYMVFVIAFAFGVIMALFIIKNNFPFPEWLMNILIIVTIGGSIIYVVILYDDILKRDISDYEKVDFGLLMDIDEVKEDSTDGLGVMLGKEAAIVSNCEGSKCCPNGSFFWGNQCNKTESFSTMPRSKHSSILSFSPLPLFTPV